MEISEILSPDRTACDINITSRKKAIEAVSNLLADETVDSHKIIDSLLARERLGTTGIGHGVAIPHGRMKNSKKTVGAFIRARDAIEYDSPDHEPVDLFFALLVPEESTEEHLEILRSLAEMFSDDELRTALREQHDSQHIFDLITNYIPQHS